MPARSTFSSVDHYLDAQSKGMRASLQLVRAAIRKAIPAAVETIAYDMPAYEVNGKRLIQFAAWKAHYALYFSTKKVAALFAPELEAEAVEIEKGTLKFAAGKPVPVALIERIAEFRAAGGARPA